ncbi:MAG: hypothetical protein KY468_06605 [Armatimonadetes bacterium]|nr:hypothetical protein [Armatimonadota bacterium]
MTDKVIRRVVATERKPSTAYSFSFRTEMPSHVGIGTLVAVYTENVKVYGGVVEGVGYTDLHSSFHDRIEVNSDPRLIGEADAISAWLMAERQPLASPGPRWDKLLYPIHDCEEYLRSIAPSHAVMDGMLGA